MYLMGENEYLIGASDCLSGMCGLSGDQATYSDLTKAYREIETRFAAMPSIQGLAAKTQAMRNSLNRFYNMYIGPNIGNPNGVISQDATDAFNSMSESFSTLEFQAKGFAGQIPMMSKTNTDLVSLPQKPQADWTAIQQQASEILSSLNPFKQSTTPPAAVQPQTAPAVSKPSAPSAKAEVVTLPPSPRPTSAQASPSSPFSFLESIFGSVGKAVSSVPGAVQSVPGAITTGVAKAKASIPSGPKAEVVDLPTQSKVEQIQAKKDAGQQLTAAEAFLLATSGVRAGAEAYASSSPQKQRIVVKGGKTTTQTQPRSMTPWIIGGVLVAGVVAATFMATAKRKV